MAITKEVVIDKIEIVTEYRHMQLREATVIKEDGVEISRSFHRTVLHAGAVTDDGEWFDADLTEEDADIRSIATACWTPAVKAMAHLDGALQALEAANGNANATTRAVEAIEARIAALTAPEDADKLTEAQEELPPAESAKLAAAAKRDTVQAKVTELSG